MSDDSDIGPTRSHLVGTRRGNLKIQIKQSPLWAVQHAPDERSGVEKADGANPEPGGIG